MHTTQRLLHTTGYSDKPLSAYYFPSVHTSRHVAPASTRSPASKKFAAEPPHRPHRCSSFSPLEYQQKAVTSLLQLECIKSIQLCQRANFTTPLQGYLVKPEQTSRRKPTSWELPVLENVAPRSHNGENFLLFFLPSRCVWVDQIRFGRSNLSIYPTPCSQTVGCSCSTDCRAELKVQTMINHVESD